MKKLTVCAFLSYKRLYGDLNQLEMMIVDVLKQIKHYELTIKIKYMIDADEFVNKAFNRSDLYLFDDQIIGFTKATLVDFGLFLRPIIILKSKPRKAYGVNVFEVHENLS